MDTKISEANPEFWRRRISREAMAKNHERNAGSGNDTAKYSGGPYPYDNDHSTEIFKDRVPVNSGKSLHGWSMYIGRKTWYGPLDILFRQ